MGTRGAANVAPTGASVETRAPWASTFVTGSSHWGGGEGVDEEEDDEGDADVHGEVDTDTVTDGTPSLSVDMGTRGEGPAPSRPTPSAAVAGLDTMDWEAAVTSWVKFAGPLVFAVVDVAVGLSCFVDHWRRC